MAISGSLEDVAVADVLQFISLGKRTGTLELERDGEHARFLFHEGTLVRAQAPGAPRLGDLLVESGRLAAGDLARAMAEQRAGSPQRTLGQILVESGLLRSAELEQAVRRQLERAVERVMSWERGAFDFALDEIRPIDEIGMETAAVEPGTGLAANVVLLEAARIFDERDRRGAPEPFGDDTEAALEVLREEPGAPGPAAAGPEVRALTPDRDLVRKLRTRLAGRARLRRVALGRATEPAGPGDSDVVLADVRAGALDPEGLALLRAARPEARIVVLVDSTDVLPVAYRHGAAAAVPAEVETVAACLASLLDTGPLQAEDERGAPAESGVRRLQRVFGDLRSGVASATVALNLMQLVSESFERAVLMLVKKDHLAALGAFGTAADGRPLATALRRIEVAPSGLLAAALSAAQAQTSDFAGADLPGALAIVLGRPAFDRVVVFPVAGTERVIAVVYADNGEVERRLQDLDLLEVAAAQVGIAFENELLRRQLGRGAS